MNEKKKHKHEDEQMDGTQPTEAEMSLEGNPDSAEREALVNQLKEAEAKVVEYKDGWARSQAEFQNYKKRIERDNELTYVSMKGDIIKKVFRDKDGQISEETRAALKAELGDVLWYIAQVATELDLSLDDIAEHNIAKLYDRLERGKIRGDGDNR